MKIPDLYRETFSLVKQIPRGRVSTYKEMALALGDIRAVRAVGRILNSNTETEAVPCYRVVKSDGDVGGYNLGIEEKIKRLKNDGITIENGKVIGLENVLFSGFYSSYPLKKLRNEQIVLAKKIILKDPRKIETLCGIDVGYKGNRQKAAAIVMGMKMNILEEKTVEKDAKFPYISTYLAFRELDAMKRVYESLKIKPDAILVDGSGILHPHGIGIASHLGVLLNKSTIGVTKTLLCGKTKGDKIIMNNTVVGCIISNKKYKPIFVSPGNRITLEKSLKIAKCFIKTRLPEPLRLAHELASY